eukprot:3893536-Karenia_brevis.AAC.1
MALVKDAGELGGWLRPNQVAIRVKAGAEVIVHSLRQWWERNRDNTTWVLLKTDYSNAFNLAEPAAFLDTACRRIPGAAALARWCYGDRVNLIYHGRILGSSRGQQGCPLMMPLFCAMKKEMRDRIEGIADIDFSADFADDGVLGGHYEHVLRVLKGEIAIGREYGIKQNFDKMVAYTLAGDKFLQGMGDRDRRKVLKEFEDLGIKLDYSGNVKFMQVPIVGDAAFIQEWINSKMAIIRRILEGLKGLSSRHVALYLLRGAGDGCRVVYYLRTIPRDMIEQFVLEFDGELRRTFGEIVGLALSDEQWEQATLGVKRSGMGICSASTIADAAYLASRAQTHDDCQ